MIDRSFRSSAAAALIGLLPVTLPAQTPQPLDAEQGWSAVARCAQQDSDRARHDCVDRVLRQAGLLTRERESQVQRRQFGLDNEAARTAAAPTVPSPSATAPASPRPPPASQTAAPASTAVSDPVVADRIELTLAAASIGNDRKVVLTSVDGAVWKQIDSDTIPRLPAAGATAIVRKGTLRSYLCELPSHHTFRCQRLK